MTKTNPLKKIILLFAGLVLLSIKNDAQTVTDYDGNVYSSVTIGTQVWLLENLNVTHYRNGDSIIQVQDSISWVTQTNGAWCHFNNDSTNGAVYGALYNGFAVVDTRGLAPLGCHVPTDEEWKTLEMYLGMSHDTADSTDWRGGNEGAMLKETDTLHWHWPSGNAATNSSGFTALGNGWRNHSNPPGYTSFINLTNTGQWWTSSFLGSDLWIRNLCVYHTDIYRTYYPQQHGCAVRCIVDFETGIKDIEEDAVLKIYPNPVSTILNIQIKCSNPVQLKIVNVLGRELVNTQLKNGTNTIDISEFDNGIYFLAVSINKRQIETTKIIIAK